MLLAIIQSLLSPGLTCDASTMLNALVMAKGDATIAAQQLNSSSSRTPVPQSTHNVTKKRKAAGLDAWLTSSEPKEPASPVKPASSSSSPQKPPSKKPRSTTTNPINLMDILKQAPTAPPSKPSPLRPLTLGTPALVAQHVPCTMHLSVLPPELACSLFYKMIDESSTWSKNKWWLFDRVVESPHLTSFYARKGEENRIEEAKYWYNGRQTEDPRPFLPEMDEACEIIEKVVNAELKKRKRFPLEWGGHDGDDGLTWRANVAASNCYRGSKEGVGPHTDQLTYLGPYPTIASLSLGTPRVFRLRETIPTSETDSRAAQTFNVPLTHNSLAIMHASCQERFKHSIPPQPSLDLFRPPFPRPSTSSTLLAKDGESDQDTTSTARDDTTSNARINITFRFYRPDRKSVV